AELLHGHNYQVAVELEGEALDSYGLLCDFVRVKSAIRRVCEELDTRTLVPAESSELELGEEGDGVVVVYRDRRYVFPARDVLVLPLLNTSIELLARWFWQQLLPAVGGSPVTLLAVSVAETAGQSCWYRAPVPGAARDADAELGGWLG
ncbi:MAG: 6-carboxytetrahydropterin synthase, partial [Acidobacteria bacterium]|nr:6-carboxytetrahydropterin synthase [Acidobacteriota bacterium]